jgi:hypothetical protein
MKTISAALLGAPLDPFSNRTRQHIALVAFLAWTSRPPMKSRRSWFAVDSPLEEQGFDTSVPLPKKSPSVEEGECRPVKRAVSINVFFPLKGPAVRISLPAPP